MSVFDDRIRKLQIQMRVDDVKAYVIPATDPHLSEASAERFQAVRKYFCAFAGQDGTLLVTRDECLIFTDGRYWVEAEMELEGTDAVLMRDGKEGVPTIQEYIRENDLYPLGLDASLFSLSELNSFYAGKDKKIVSLDYSFMVEDLPSLPKGKIWKVDESLLSKTRNQRISDIIKEAQSQGAQDVILCALDDIAYAIGYRGNDIANTPVFYSYLYIESNGHLHLFIDEDKIPEDFDPDIEVHPYGAVFDFVRGRDQRISIDTKRANSKIYKAIQNPVKMRSPAYRQKSLKGEVEIEHNIMIHQLDGICVLKLQKFIDDNAKNGDLDEYKIAQFIDSERLNQEECFDLSFETIAAFDSNAAMMHYAPTKEKCAKVDPEHGLVLVDSGGQYYGGTTDITRTFLIGEPDPEVVRDYTLTLKSQIAVSKSVFINGCSGHSLDYAAREIMWKEGLDYKCGTGHGVGYMSCVHEGPIGFRYYDSPLRDDKEVLQPGHVITIEPGVYKDGLYGIRLENELVVRPAFTNEQGTFYRFQTITYCPYDRKGIDVSMLDDEELEWLNNYLAMVRTTLTPLIDDNMLLVYLYKQTQPFTR